MQIFADGFTKMTMSNNNIRIQLTQNGPDNTQETVATLIVPANQAANLVNGLANSLKQLDEQIRAQSGPEGAEQKDLQ